MLFSVVDDRSGVAYQEYRCVYGEDVAAALRFLFNAMAPKDEPGLVLQGIPAMLYLDNGPVTKSATFRRVMAQLGVDVRTHMPRGSDGRRVTARSEGQGRAAVPDRQGSARNTLPFPYPAERGGSQSLAAQLPGPLQRPAAPVRAAFAGRGLVVQPAGTRPAGDVRLGTVPHLRARARAPTSGRRCQGHGGWRQLRSRIRRWLVRW